MATRQRADTCARELRLRRRDSQQQFAAYMGRAISTVVRYELSRPAQRNGLRRYVGGAPRSTARPTRAWHGRLPGRARRGFSGAVGDRAFHRSRRYESTPPSPQFAASAADHSASGSGASR